MLVHFRILAFTEIFLFFPDSIVYTSLLNSVLYFRLFYGFNLIPVSFSSAILFANAIAWQTYSKPLKKKNKAITKIAKAKKTIKRTKTATTKPLKIDLVSIRKATSNCSNINYCEKNGKSDKEYLYVWMYVYAATCPCFKCYLFSRFSLRRKFRIYIVW